MKEKILILKSLLIIIYLRERERERENTCDLRFGIGKKEKK
jgi:hypothetical protein